MSDEPWTKRDDETQRAYEVFCVYRDMGPGRSLPKTHDEEYGKDAGNVRIVEKWSSAYDWPDRAHAYDLHLEELRRAEYEKEMTTGLANAGARVRELKELAHRLKDEMQEHLWLQDFKITPQGGTIPIRKYNSPLVRDWQRALDHIAKEVGGRKQQVDVTTQGQALDGGIDVQISGAVPLITRPDDDESELDEDAA